MKTKTSLIMNRYALSAVLFITSFLITSSLVAQVPQGIPYQAMIRGNDGAALENANVTVRFTLHQNTTAGPVEYQETQALTTNAYGLINTQFGTGTPTQGNFSGIVWSNTSKFIQVEANDGNGYLDMGTQQMMSVPYAMYAGSAGQSIVPLGTQTGDMLYWDSASSTWTPLPSGTNGQALYNCDGVPTWGGCAPIVGNLTVSGITPYTAYAEFPMSSNGGSAPTSIGFYLSTSSNVSPSNGQFLGGTWPGGGISNWINSNSASVPGGSGTVKSGNDGATSIANLSPNTQYFLIGAVTNAKGTTATPMLSFNTPVLVEGCMESGACNYNPTANYNVGCFYAAYGYLCDGGCAGDADQDGVCDAFDACSDVNACNYNIPQSSGCAYDSDGDNICDDQDGCLDNNACNWQANSPFTSCQYAEIYRSCDGTCINDLDGDNVCDEIDDFICANDLDNDQVCDDIDQCTDVSACNYNMHWFDISYSNYSCRYDTDNDGFCPINPAAFNPFIDWYSTYNNYPSTSFDYCEDPLACNSMGNGSFQGTILEGSINYGDPGLLGAYNFIENGSQSYIQLGSHINHGSSNPYFGCIYDADSDGICDINDNCHDLNACNYLNSSNEPCFPDYDDDGICDNLDGCYNNNYCNYNNPNSTSCQPIGGLCDTPEPNTYGTYDANCQCQQYNYFGCTDANACNYDYNAWYENGSCLYLNSPCNGGLVDQNCICQPTVSGCTDPSACNYDSNAWPDNGTCLYYGTYCDDGDSYTINDMINGNCQCQGAQPLYTPGAGVTDIDGNFYPSIILYGQEWMQKNLAVSKYRNGDPIITGLDDATWHSSTEGAYTFFGNNFSNNAIHGKMYNWYAVADPRGLCPAGWHAPSSNEWVNLRENLGGYLVAAAKLKSSNAWDNSYGQSTNESGFTALPSGNYYNGNFGYLGTQTWWWGSNFFPDSENGPVAYSFSVYWGPEVITHADNTNAGLSVRCLKD